MQQGGQSKSSSGAYGFDPTGLERAAKAARELDGSSHAKDAFQISIKQEETKKAEFETKRKEIEMQIVQVEQAEKRKTLQHEFEMSKAKAEYEDQLTKKRYQQQLQDHAKMQEQNRLKDEQSVQKQEQMKRQTIEYEQKLRRENDQFFLQQKEAMKIQRMRDTKDIRHEDIRLKENERRKTLQDLWSMNLTNVGKGLHSYLTDFHNLATLSAGLTLTFFGFQFARSSARVVTRLVESRIGKPALVRETSRPTTLGQYLSVPIRKLQKKKSDVLQGIIIDENLEKNLRTISHAILNKKKHFAPYRNLLLYGPPGTGKTLFAKSLALNSGMEFAILTGGDIGPLGREGVHELHKLFDWSRTSRKGVLLFVDEADAFLRKRASDEIISEHMRNAINAFLYRTGTESHDFMLVLASNAPEQLDRAIHDRLDEMVFFDRPGEQQRLQMLYHYMLKYVSIHRSFLDRLKEFWRNPRGFFQKTEIGMKDVDAVHIESAAKKTEGFSGREIFKLVVAWHDAAFSKQNAVLTPEIMEEVLLNHIEQHQQRRMWEKFKIYNQQPISQILNTVKNVEKEEKLGEAS